MTFCQKELPTPCQFIHYKVISIFFTGVFCVGCDVRCCMLSEQRKKSQHSLVYDTLGRRPPQCKTFKWFTHFYQGCKSHPIITNLTFQLSFCGGVCCTWLLITCTRAYNCFLLLLLTYSSFGLIFLLISKYSMFVYIICNHYESSIFFPFCYTLFHIFLNHTLQ